MREDQERRINYMIELGLKDGVYQKQFNLPNPGITLTWILRILLLFLKPVMAVITPILRRELEDAILKFYHKAIESVNPWDDFLAVLLLEILDIPIPE